MSDDATAIEVWAAKLEGDSPEEQVTALRQISGQDVVKGLTPAIINLAGSRDDEVRMWSAEALESSVQPQATDVLPLVGLLGRDVDDGEIGYWAATMLGRLGRDAASAAQALETCLRESMYLPARERAAWALSQVGDAAAIAIPTLREAAETAPPRLSRLAAETLRAITPEDATNESDDSEELAA